jgi:pimeloyl-[acyl-carrier protein] methyl ester esterase
MALLEFAMGIGADLVLLHGWGFNSALFSHLVDDYKNQYRITLIDLPGHGRTLEILKGKHFMLL